MKFNTPAAAQRLGVKPKTLENWRSAGVGPAFMKIGSRVVYDERDLEQFEQAARRTSTADRGQAA